MILRICTAVILPTTLNHGGGGWGEDDEKTVTGPGEANAESKDLLVVAIDKAGVARSNAVVIE